MAMTGFFCHDDYLAKTSKLTDEEFGRLFRALIRYHATGEEVEIDGRESIAFDFIKEDIDRTEQSYKDKCEKNRNNRLSAIANAQQPKEQTLTNVDERQQTSTDSNERSQYKEKEKDKDKDKNNICVNKRFTPPTLEEVKEYCQERKNHVDPEKFIDFYASKGWKVGNQPMKDWKACVRTWEKGSNYSGSSVKSSGKPDWTHNYQQRDNTGRQAEMMKQFAEQIGRETLRGVGA